MDCDNDTKTPQIHVENDDTKGGLKREINLLGGTSLLIGTIIGSGIFASPTSVAMHSGSVGASLIIWSGCGLISTLAALSWVELGTMFPNKSGGEYAYIKEAFGDLPGFIYVYVSVIVIKPSSLAIIAITCGDYVMAAFDYDNQTYEKLVACGLIGVILFINCASVKLATNIQVIFTAAKLLAVALLVITGFVRLGQGYNNNLQNSFNGTNTRLSSIGYAFYGGLWAYDGWNNLNLVTEELKEPIRDLPLAIMIGIPLVTTSYVLLNITYVTVLTTAEISTSNAVAVTLAKRLYGVMAWIIPVFVACSTFGAANGSAFTGGRLVYAAARDGHLPKLLAMVHNERHTPLPALIFTSVISWLMLIPESSNFGTLINYFNFATWTFYGTTLSALLWLRYKQPDLKRPYKVFIGIPIIVLLCSIYLVIAPFYDYPLESTYCLLFIFSAIPIYFAFVKYKILPSVFMKGFDGFTVKMQSVANLSMPGTQEICKGHENGLKDIVAQPKDTVDDIDVQKAESKDPIVEMKYTEAELKPV